MLDRRQIPVETVSVMGLDISHAVQGNGAPVLMLHGWGAELGLVWPLAKALSALGYRVYALDLPGFGTSAEPPQAWSVFDYAQFVLAYMDSQGLEQAHLFGHSFGGRLGLILGADAPQRIAKLVLADAAGLRRERPPLQRLRLNTYQRIRDGLNTVGLKSLSEKLRGWYNRRYGSTDFNAVSGVMRQTFVQVVNQDLRDYARRVQAPTLLIWGEKDADTPLLQGRELERLIPDAGLVVYPGAGHYSYLEHVQQTAQAMNALFSG